MKRTQKEKTKSKSLPYLIYFATKIFWKENRLLMLLIFIFGFISYLIPQIESYLSGRVIDVIIDNIQTATSLFNSEIIRWFGMLIGLLIFSSLIYKISDFVYQIDELMIPLFIDRIILTKTITLDPQLFENPRFIQQKTKIDWNAWRIRRTVDDIIDIVARTIVTILILITVIQYNWILSVLIVLSIVPGTILTFIFGKRVWNIWDNSGEEKIIYEMYKDNLYTEDIDRFQEIKVLGYGKYLTDKAIQFNQKFVNRTISLEKKRNIFSFLSTLIEYGCIALVLYILFTSLLNEIIPVGTFYFLSSIIWNIRGNLNRIFYKSATIVSNRNLLQAFYDFLTTPNLIKNGSIQIDNQKPIEIQFKNVWFKYPKTKRWILKNIDFTIKSDEDIAIVGKNGAGKTTLIKLLLRIYHPTKGEIYINNVPLKDIDIDSLYNSIGILSQRFNTPGIPVDENIYLGDTQKKINSKKVQKAARLAKADHFIQKYPRTYKTFLSKSLEGGIAPSGGEWQRLAIARVFYKDPKLLILDEPTSAIDSLAEEEIFENIQNNAQNKTVIMISHRFATVKKSKRIVVMDNGTIVQNGTHTELTNKDGLYKKMYETQTN